MTTLTFYTTTLVATECYKCGVPFGVPTNLDEHWRASGETFFCPNGHGQHYTMTTVAKLRQQVEQLNTEVNWQRDQRKAAQAETESVKHALRAEKGAKTKLKKRIANGVCPCCQRHFVNVERHIKGQHPEYVAEK